MKWINGEQRVLKFIKMLNRVCITPHGRVRRCMWLKLIIIYVPKVALATNGIALRITSNSVHVNFIKRLLCKLICGVTVSTYFYFIVCFLPKRLFEQKKKIVNALRGMFNRRNCSFNKIMSVVVELVILNRPQDILWFIFGFVIVLLVHCIDKRLTIYVYSCQKIDCLRG